MFELPATARTLNPASTPYRGPERRRVADPAVHWLAQSLDEIDYGMLVLGGDGQVLHANRAARNELDDSHPLQLLGRAVRARHSRDVVTLHEALMAASTRGLRRLLTLGEPGLRTSLAIIPLGSTSGAATGTTLVMLGKRLMCEALIVECFARTHDLTDAESRVLAALCRGLPPGEIAGAHGVRIATVRTQINAIRQKTDAQSIRGLLDTVAKLPPMASLVRPTATYATAAAAATMAGWQAQGSALPN